MMKDILIIGGNGNMGRRYAAVLKYLGAFVEINEIGTGESETIAQIKRADGVIIATPTTRHRSSILQCEQVKQGIPILCEKPVVGNASNLNQFDGMNLQMVNQYKYLAPETVVGPHTMYDFYNSGGDGLEWDCINLIGLDQTGNIILRKESPIWKCVINGKPIDRSDIDLSYVIMVRRWLQDPAPNLDYVKAAHMKVRKLLLSKSSSESKPEATQLASPVRSISKSGASQLLREL